MAKKKEEQEAFPIIGYFVIITMAVQILPKLPYPEDTLGWALAMLGYSLVVSLICAGFWYAAYKSK